MKIKKRFHEQQINHFEPIEFEPNTQNWKVSSPFSDDPSIWPKITYVPHSIASNSMQSQLNDTIYYYKNWSILQLKYKQQRIKITRHLNSKSVPIESHHKMLCFPACLPWIYSMAMLACMRATRWNRNEDWRLRTAVATELTACNFRIGVSNMWY